MVLLPRKNLSTPLARVRKSKKPSRGRVFFILCFRAHNFATKERSTWQKIQCKSAKQGEVWRMKVQEPEEERLREASNSCLFCVFSTSFLGETHQRFENKAKNQDQQPPSGGRLRGGVRLCESRNRPARICSCNHQPCAGETMVVLFFPLIFVKLPSFEPQTSRKPRTSIRPFFVFVGSPFGRFAHAGDTTKLSSFARLPPPPRATKLASQRPWFFEFYAFTFGFSHRKTRLLVPPFAMTHPQTTTRCCPSLPFLCAETKTQTKSWQNTLSPQAHPSTPKKSRSGQSSQN